MNYRICKTNLYVKFPSIQIHFKGHFIRGRAVGIATRLDLDSSRFEARRRDFIHPSRPSLTTTQLLLHNWRVISFSGVKRPGRGADYQPTSTTEVKNEWSYTSTPPSFASTEILWGDLYLY